MAIHRDIIDNHWAGAEQRRIGRIEGRDDVVRWEIFNRDGDYRFITEPHDVDTCPFKDGDVIPMRKIPPANLADDDGCPND